MISILCPSRGRAAMLAESIRSLDPGRFYEEPDPHPDLEILVYVDEDDPELQKYCDLHENDVIEHLFIGPRHGYRGFHHYINELAGEATGEWLMLWNDDARMHSMSWMSVVREHDRPTPVVLNFNYGYPGQNWFPAINRAWYRAVGHFSLSPHCDTWVQDVGGILDLQVQVEGVVIEHLRDEIDDPTKQESQPIYEITSPAHYSDTMQALKHQDAEAIRKVMA